MGPESCEIYTPNHKFFIEVAVPSKSPASLQPHFKEKIKDRSIP